MTAINQLRAQARRRAGRTPACDLKKRETVSSQPGGRFARTGHHLIQFARGGPPFWAARKKAGVEWRRSPSPPVRHSAGLFPSKMMTG
jgi:hypothetical protein